jgi:hypothetical protein
MFFQLLLSLLVVIGAAVISGPAGAYHLPMASCLIQHRTVGKFIGEKGIKRAGKKKRLRTWGQRPF